MYDMRLVVKTLMVIAAVAADGAVPFAQADLSERDVAAIQRLVSEYGRTLGTCAAEEYAELFEQPAGYFESLNRGRVRGRETLQALARSERQCDLPPEERTTRPMPAPTLRRMGSVVAGVVSLAGNGHYEDVYVQTEQGWRFRSRNYIPPAAEKAGFTASDFAGIHEAAGDQDQFEDVYVDGAGGRRFRSSGLTIEPVSPERAKGRARLGADRGHYEDIYVKSEAGWRLESRRHVPAPTQNAR
jgi:hypothetical protein